MFKRQIIFLSISSIIFTLPLISTSAAESGELIAPIGLPIAEPTANSNFVFKKGDANGNFYHWDTCKEYITWTIFPGAPEKIYPLAVRNFQTVANATGFSFKYVDSSKLPAPKTYKEAKELDYAGIQMYYGLRSSFVGTPSVLNGETNGVDGGSTGKWNGSFFETTKQTTGQVTDFQYPADDFAQRGLGIVMLHELGHAMGLAHSTGNGDVMGKIKPHTGQFGPGDLNGLYKLSAGIPCGAAAKTNESASTSATKILCIKGKLQKKVSGINPVCPKGYVKKR
jgi:Matrixin